MKILFITCFYNRPQISKLYLLGLERLKKVHDLDVLIYCSDEESLRLCENEGITHYYFENLPLGKKHNKLYNEAIKKDYDYIIHSGDDNVMSDNLFSLYINEFKKGSEYIKSKGLYFYKGGRVLEFHPENTFGAFRAFKVSMLRDLASCIVTFTETINVGGRTYEQGKKYKMPKYIANYYVKRNRANNLIETELELYDNNINFGLDFSSESTILEARVKETIISTIKPEIIDFKSQQNIWKFERYYTMCKDAKKEEIYRIIGEKEKEYLESL